MCRAVPRKILEVAGERARVDYEGRPTWVDTPGLSGLEAGEYVIVYAGQALERIPTAEAEEFLDFEADLERMLEEATQ